MTHRRQNPGSVGRVLLAAFGVCGTVLGAGTLYQAHRAGSPLETGPALYHQMASLGMRPAYADPLTRADRPLVIYGDTLGEGWEDWSWAPHKLHVTEHPFRGAACLSMEVVGNKGIYFHHAPLATDGYAALEFHLRGTAGLDICVTDPDGHFLKKVALSKYLPESKETASGWRQVRIPLKELIAGTAGTKIAGIVFQAAQAERQPDVLLDEITLQPDAALPAAQTTTEIAVSVDLDADRHTISPYIYGMAWAPDETLSDLHIPVNRWGGNARSRYNWVHGNATNSARDWKWANRLADPQAPNVPSGAADRFVTRNAAHGAATILTIPTIGWVARNASQESASVGVPEEGGPPLMGANGGIAGYDPTANRLRTSVESRARKGRPFTDPPAAGGEVYQDEWVHHLVGAFGSAAKGGVQFYSMDNEPDLWDSTHTDIHPARMGYEDLLSTFLEYSTAVKDVDPQAQVTGPSSWGWTGYQYSPLDAGSDRYRTHADRRAHGDKPFLLWFLQEVRAHDLKAGKRSLDVLDVHYYPQGRGLYPGDTGAAGDELRLRSTRSLWDPNYVDESWIREPIQLIPRLKEWIAAGYPGTKIGITEWNFGAENRMNGALAIADVLGIFGREGVYLANYWTNPPRNSPGYLAFKLYRNADGKGHGFGDVACRATSADNKRLAAYGAVDTAAHVLTVVLINKTQTNTVTVPLSVGGARISDSARLWRLSGGAGAALTEGGQVTLRNGRAVVPLPPTSVTLLRVPSVGPPVTP